MFVSNVCLALLWGAVHAGRLSTKQVFERQAGGFPVAPDWVLQGSLLDSNCKGVLQQPINCDEYVAELGEKEYHGSLEDAKMTDNVCATTCDRALTTAQRRIAGACAKTPEISPGVPVSSLLDPIIAGYKETCLKDKTTGDYCNSIIDSWGEIESLEKMPQDKLCSYCYGSKLRLMQSSPYSAYDDLYAARLEYVNKKCGVEGPTAPIDNPININVTIPDTCEGNKEYLAKTEDTCDSIALARSLSSATLYYNNPNLHDCSSIEAGTKLCLPDSCETVYTVKENDDCVNVGIDQGASWRSIVDWNLGLDSFCTNIWGAKPSFGTTICVTPPGGEFRDEGSGTDNPTPGNGDLGGQGGSGDGYADTVVDAPDGKVGKDTTKVCGEYIQAKEGVDCSTMLVSTTNAVPMDVFLEANPSLKTALACDTNLESGTWYCLRMVR